MPPQESNAEEIIRDEDYLQEQPLHETIDHATLDITPEAHVFHEQAANSDQYEAIPTPEVTEIIPETVAVNALERKQIDQDVIERFASLGFSKEDIESLEGFDQLSRGQQSMVFENLNQLTVGRIREEARDQAEETSKEEKSKGFLRRVYTGVKESFGAKKINIAKNEKELRDEMTQGGMEVHGETLKQLVEGMRNYGPAVVEREDGSLRVEYLESDGLTPEEKERINAFNEDADTFSRLPYEWSLGTATKEQQEEYHAKQLAFDMRKKQALDILRSHTGDAGAVEVMANIEYKMTLQRHLTTCEDATQALEDIEDQSVWTNALKSTVAEKGLYASMGAIARTATSSLLGVAAGPLAASLVGGVRGYIKAKEDLREQDRAMRQGKIEAAPSDGTAQNMVEAGGEQGAVAKMELMINRINTLDEEIAEIGDQDPDALEKKQKKRAQLVAFLDERVSYVNQKVDEGKMIFGERSERLKHQYELMSVTQRARAMVLASGTEVPGYARTEELSKRINDLLAKTDENINDARKRSVVIKTATATALAGGLASVSYIAVDALKWMGGAQSTYMEKMFGAYDESKQAELERMLVAAQGVEVLSIDPAESLSPGEELVPSFDAHAVNGLDLPPDYVMPGEVGGEWVKTETGLHVLKAELVPPHEVVRGDTLGKIVGDAFPGKSQGEILGVLRGMSADELRSIGITSGNPDLIYPGEHVDLAKLSSFFERTGGVSSQNLSGNMSIDTPIRTTVQEFPNSSGAAEYGGGGGGGGTPPVAHETSAVLAASEEAKTEVMPAAPLRGVKEYSQLELANWSKDKAEPFPLSEREAEDIYDFKPDFERAHSIQKEIGRYPNRSELQMYTTLAREDEAAAKLFVGEMKRSPMSQQQIVEFEKKLDGAGANAKPLGRPSRLPWINKDALATRSREVLGMEKPLAPKDVSVESILRRDLAGKMDNPQSFGPVGSESRAIAEEAYRASSAYPQGGMMRAEFESRGGVASRASLDPSAQANIPRSPLASAPSQTDFDPEGLDKAKALSASRAGGGVMQSQGVVAQEIPPVSSRFPNDPMIKTILESRGSQAENYRMQYEQQIEIARQNYLTQKSVIEETNRAMSTQQRQSMIGRASQVLLPQVFGGKSNTGLGEIIKQEAMTYGQQSVQSGAQMQAQLRQAENAMQQAIRNAGIAYQNNLSMLERNTMQQVTQREQALSKQ